MKKFKKLYHATTPILLPTIIEEGLRVMDDCTYFATNSEDAFRFAITYRTATTLWADDRITGEIQHDTLTVLEIDATGLDWDSHATIMLDNQRIFFNPIVVYTKDIPAAAIVQVMERDNPFHNISVNLSQIIQ